MEQKKKKKKNSATLFSFFMWCLENFLLYQRLIRLPIGRHSSKASSGNLARKWQWWPSVSRRPGVSCLIRHCDTRSHTAHSSLPSSRPARGPQLPAQDSIPTSQPGNPFLLSAFLSPTLKSPCRPALGRSPGEGNDNPLQYSCLRNPWTEEPGTLPPRELQQSQTRLSNSTTWEQSLGGISCEWSRNSWGICWPRF